MSDAQNEFDRRREADVLIEVGHPSRPDREELMREHIARIKARAWEEGVVAAHRSDLTLFAIKQVNPYQADRVISPGLTTHDGNPT